MQTLIAVLDDTILVFDFDGVIADSMPLQEKCWTLAVDEIVGDGKEKALGVIRTNLYAGMARERVFKNVNLPPDIRNRLRARKDELWQAIAAQTPLFNGAKELIRALSRRYAVSIATTAGRKYAESILAREAIIDVPKLIITDADVQNPKPAPDMLFEIARSLRSEPDKLCVIGDTLTDLEMANSAHASFIWFGSSPPKAGELSAQPLPSAASWPELYRMLIPNAA